MNSMPCIECANINQLINSVKSYEYIVIYGAGAVAHSVIRYLLDNDIEKRRIRVVVSKLNDEEQTICGISIWGIEKCKDFTAEDIVFIVSVMGETKEIMAETAKKYCSNVIVLKDEVCTEIRHLSGDYALEVAEIRNELTHKEQQIANLKEALVRVLPQQNLNYLVLNILDHCNLNCKGCDHFASIAEKRFIPYKTIESDISRLSDIFKGDITRIGIMGGEPLLHPRLLDIVQTVRKYFPDSKIQIDTNGMLLMQQPEEFWKVCRDNRIFITQTKYPINLDFEEISKKAEKENVLYEYYGNTGEVLKTSYKICMDESGKQDARCSFVNCFHANNCVTLLEGKIFTCTVAPNAHIFNKKYGTNMMITEDDYIDIYSSAVTKKQILDFLANPIPFCRFCDVDHRSFGHEWCISEGRKEEWIR